MLHGSGSHSLIALLVVLHALGSLLTFVVFGVDKRRARKNERRIPERTLHALTLCFGPAGAILGMVLLLSFGEGRPSKADPASTRSSAPSSRPSRRRQNHHEECQHLVRVVVVAAHLRPRDDIAHALGSCPSRGPLTSRRTPGSVPALTAAPPMSARGARGWPRSPRGLRCQPRSLGDRHTGRPKHPSSTYDGAAAPSRSSSQEASPRRRRGSCAGRSTRRSPQRGHARATSPRRPRRTATRRPAPPSSSLASSFCARAA